MTHFLWKNKFPRELMGSARSWVTHFLLWRIVKETKQHWSAIVEWGKVGSLAALEESQSALVHWKGHVVQHLKGNQSPHFHYLPIRSAVILLLLGYQNMCLFSLLLLLLPDPSIHYSFHPQCIMGSTSYHLVLATALCWWGGLWLLLTQSTFLLRFSEHNSINVCKRTFSVLPHTLVLFRQ